MFSGRGTHKETIERFPLVGAFFFLRPGLVRSEVGSLCRRGC